MKFKDELNIEDITMLHPALYPVLGFLFAFCFENQVPCKITSMIRVGDHGPHGTARAVDFSVKGWSKFHRDKFEHQVMAKYNYLGAYSGSDGVQRLIVFHGPVLHGHLQVKF